MSKIKEQSLECTLASTTAYVGSDGRVQFCCRYKLSKHTEMEPYTFTAKNLISSPDFSFAAERSRPDILRVRESLQAGIWPDECNSCQQEEAGGWRSRRQIYNHEWSRIHKLQSEELGSIRGLDLRLGNICNLKCRMCSPNYSQKWVREHEQVYNEKPSTTDPLKDFNWSKSAIAMDRIKELMPDIRYLSVAGGEPLIQPEFFDLLEFIVAKGYAKNIELWLNTNLTVLPERFLELISAFQHVRIAVSVDATGLAAEYIRSPSDWGRVSKNIIALNALDCPNLERYLQVTMQSYNAFEVPDLIKWRIQNELHNFNTNSLRPLITPVFLHQPEHLALANLPKNVKINILEYWRKYRAELQAAIYASPYFSQFEAEYLSAYDKLTSYLETQIRLQDPTNKNAWKKLQAFTRKMDQIRGEDFEISLPRLASYFDPIEEQSAVRSEVTQLTLL